MTRYYEIKHAALLKAILYFGGQNKLAKKIQKSPTVINNWLNRGDCVPYEYAIVIEELTQGCVSVEELSPESPANKIIRKYIKRG
jgi:DNA-binding transcriptional regulator YdaS (Cro superfamily)